MISAAVPCSGFQVPIRVGFTLMVDVRGFEFGAKSNRELVTELEHRTRIRNRIKDRQMLRNSPPSPAHRVLAARRCCRIDELLDEAVKLKMPALAVTEHGNMFSSVVFHDHARAWTQADSRL